MVAEQLIIPTATDPAERPQARGPRLRVEAGPAGHAVHSDAGVEATSGHPAIPEPDPMRLEGNNFSGNTQHPRSVQAIPVL